MVIYAAEQKYKNKNQPQKKIEKAALAAHVNGLAII